MSHPSKLRASDAAQPPRDQPPDAVGDTSKKPRQSGTRPSLPNILKIVVLLIVYSAVLAGLGLLHGFRWLLPADMTA